MAPLRARVAGVNPAVPLVYSFLALIAIGTVLLMLPISTADGSVPSPIVAFFTATSAVTVTGLVVVDTADFWSFFGQAVILVLIQLGGFGITASSTLLLLLVGRRATLRERLILGQALGGSPLGLTLVVIRQVALATVIVEAVGFALLLPRFAEMVPLGQAVWWSLFHSISGFNHAGFDLMGDFQSLLLFSGDPYILTVFAALIVLSAVGYTALIDLVRFGRLRRLTLDTKLVLVTSGILWVAGAVVILLLELRNPLTLGAMPHGHAIVNAIFLSVSARSAGFSTFDLSNALDPTLIWIIALMFIGGAAGSVAGGIKVNTFSTLYFSIISTVKGRTRVEAFGREIPQVQVYRALTVALLAIAVVFIVAFTLEVLEGGPFVPLLFDTVSAAGVVGLSTGLPQSAETLGRLVLAVTIFVGRLGPLTLVLALAARERPVHYRLAEEQVKIG